MALHPNNEQVAVAWLKQIAYLGNNVATTLPTDNATWSASGFVAATVVGGTPDIELPVNKPIISVDCYAVAANSGQPPWNKAAQLAQEVKLAAAPDRLTVGRRVTLPAPYNNARVMQAIVRTEPRRVPGDAASYAHYQMDMELVWVEIS